MAGGVKLMIVLLLRQCFVIRGYATISAAVAGDRPVATPRAVGV